ncbi:type IV pili methyl-accepting chemotaxis transducer N-terminal domain-containing protein [Hydrogenophaga sp.]|uniref:type IV pili methyl-accepting chemotaxis transducer N-terminal domain-containing protein n=1 Tax=Hydrogenophaga sp. TaxID=1904254 RepID=UPI0027318DEF|nr:type IV pili methyl-accepting chemotaxis transducer N-terminal domain-containing protein [Hydrogenophaga sp.]MDP1685089.1 type IV pili methyl-accepting chemotaxis transducer N-terminal domain-containing protein [Hydrogenophaga sp.]
MTTFAAPKTALQRTDTPAHVAGLSLVNLAARQRMLSQRMILQTVLAAQGDVARLQAAQRSLKMFTESQQHLLNTAAQLEPGSAGKITETYQGTRGVGPVVQAFMQLVRSALDQIEAASPRAGATTTDLVGHTDRILEALNTATTAFDEVAKARSDTMMKELAGIVDDIQSVAKEAKVVSFNAQVMAARAGQHGREFAVVANVLSDITGEIDRLTCKAAVLAERSRSNG